MFVLNRNGFVLIDALFGLFVLLLCSALLLNIFSLISDEFGFYIGEKIEKEWFYSD